MNCNKIIKWWLAGILFYLPFMLLIQTILRELNLVELISGTRFLDEATVVIVFLLAVWKLFKNKEIFDPLYLTLAIPCILFTVWGFISGVVNDNPLLLTLIGTFDYIKYFLLIFIYAAFFRDFNSLKKIFRYFLLMGIIFFAVAVIEEVWALVFRYVLGRDILDPSMYLLREPPSDSKIAVGIWRYGMLRASSIIMKIDWLGYISLFILTIYIFMNKKLNPLIYWSLISTILLTVSRSAYAGLCIVLMFYLILQKLKGSKLAITLISIAVIIIVAVINFDEIYLDQTGVKENNTITYREYAREKGLTIWKDHPLVGVGPGRFGGVVSKVYPTPLYNEYNFNLNLLERFGGIDQFWPQILAETGIVGLGLFLVLIISLIKALLILRDHLSNNEEQMGLITGLLVFIMVVYVYTFGASFYTTAISFPYFAFIGICFGVASRRF